MLENLSKHSLGSVNYAYPGHTKIGDVIAMIVNARTMLCCGYVPDSSPDLEHAEAAARNFKKCETSWVVVIVRVPNIILQVYYEGELIL